MNSVERYIKSPTPFMVHNWEKLLPDWQVPPQTIVIVLINSQFPLDEEGELIEQEKDRLLKQFMQWGQSFHLMSQKQGFLTEIICPKEGIPQYSKKGDAHFDLVATVHHSLGFNFSTVRGFDTPRSKETGILGSQRLLAKDRIASEKVEVFSPQAFLG
ncbi:MAG: hypothetical protein GPJ06_23030, partial [Microcystis aeruginosa G13-11]|nr:hypothetical protein [Microcystis aeruginosa G13-11]